MMAAEQGGATDLVRFVRETLGCGCPDDTLARIVVERGADGSPGLDVGGRLLVATIPHEDLDGLIDGFPEVVERLRSERDRRGFNRVRIVVVHPSPDALGETLTEMLGAVLAADNRVHVHVLTPDELPKTLIDSE
jgi:hypothetical protein